MQVGSCAVLYIITQLISFCLYPKIVDDRISRFTHVYVMHVTCGPTYPIFSSQATAQCAQCGASKFYLFVSRTQKMVGVIKNREHTIRR